MAVQNLTLISSALSTYTAQAQGVAGQGEQPAARQSPTDVKGRQPADSSQVRLSVAGQLRAGLDALQAQARRLQEAASSASPQEIRNAVRNFVQSFNALNDTAAAARNAPDNPFEVKQQVTRVQDEMRRALQGTAPEAGQALQNIGVTAQRDGTLTVNQARLDAALRDNRAAAAQTIVDVATRVQATAQRQLAEGVTAPTSQPETRQPSAPATPQRDTPEARLEAQRAAQRLQLSQQLAAGYVARNAVASYFNVSLL